MYKAKALCPDAKIRVVYHGEPDTFFSIPASVTVSRNGKRIRIHGYLTGIGPDSVPPSLHTKKGLEFRPYMEYREILPNYLPSVKAIYLKATTGCPPKWRWIWYDPWYNEKWGCL